MSATPSLDLPSTFLPRLIAQAEARIAELEARRASEHRMVATSANDERAVSAHYDRALRWGFGADELRCVVSFARSLEAEQLERARQAR